MAGTRRIEPATRTVLSQGLELSYLDWGDPGAPLLLLVHGIAEHAHGWDRTARELCRDWHVVAPDLRGHGDSAWSADRSYLSSCYLLDIANLLVSLAVERANVVAHSLGGNIMARFAAVYPERVASLVLIEGLGPSAEAYTKWQTDGPVRRTREWLDTQQAAPGRPARQFASIADVQTRLMKANPRLPAELALELAQHAVRPAAQGFVWKHDPLVSAFTPEDFSLEGARFWKEIAAPTLLLQGAQSWATNPEVDGRALHFRQRRTVVVEGAGHWVQHDQFAAFMAALNDFL